MAIFSFRPPSGSGRRPIPTGAAADWAETRPSLLPEPDSLGVDRPGAFATDPPVDAGHPVSSPALRSPVRPTTPHAPAVSPRTSLGTGAAVAAAFGEAGDPRLDPGFAKSLTARAQNDDLLGAGWYISSWDLMQGCDVIEGTPIDQLPAEWQRKRPRA